VNWKRGEHLEEGDTVMWDLAEPPSTGTHLSHDLPCLKCGHAAHQYLSCSDTCACVPPPTPGSVQRDDHHLLTAA